MAKRRTNRKVTIHFKGRSPEDPLWYLNAVEEAFRPQNIDVVVSEAAGPSVSNEPLETLAREHVANILDEKAKCPASASTSTQADEASPSERQVHEIGRSGAKLAARVIRLLKQGWTITAKVVPVLKGVKDLLG